MFGIVGQTEGSEYIAWARSAITSVVSGRASVSHPASGKSQPVFVTIEVDGTIRGCRGSLVTRTSTLAEEVRDAARSAAAFDPRYRPLQASELEKMKVTVTIVARMEAISDVRGLLPADGLVLKSGEKTGVVLPWEGKDAQVRLKWAYTKAKVNKGASVNLYRLVAERYRG